MSNHEQFDRPEEVENRDDLVFGPEEEIEKEPDNHIHPGDEFVLINPDTNTVVDLADVDEMEEYAAILDTGQSPGILDSDVEDLSEYTDDEDILDDFADRQNMVPGTTSLIERLSNYTGRSSETSAGDIDATWHYSDQGGEEQVGGSAPTPDQDIVDELGKAVGVSYEDDEELNTEDKLNARDEHRWELDAASTDEEGEDESLADPGIEEGLR